MSGDKFVVGNGESGDGKKKDETQPVSIHASPSETTLLSPVNTYFSDERILIPETESVSRNKKLHIFYFTARKLNVREI